MPAGELLKWVLELLEEYPAYTKAKGDPESLQNYYLQVKRNPMELEEQVESSNQMLAIFDDHDMHQNSS